METIDNFKVGDYVFLFFNKSGSIFSARILEKTIRETISDGPKTDFVIEAYQQEGDRVVPQKIKFTSDCKMFHSVEELRIAVHEHVMSAVNSMVEDCYSIYTIISQDEVG